MTAPAADNGQQFIALAQLLKAFSCLYGPAIVVVAWAGASCTMLLSIAVVDARAGGGCTGWPLCMGIHTLPLTFFFHLYNLITF